MEIRGYTVDGASLNVVNHRATIRPLSNVNYQSSERVKNNRFHPWSHLHPQGTSSRNSSLLPIADVKHSSMDNRLMTIAQSNHEE